MVSRESLMERWAWRPIRNCPGRYVAIEVDPFATVDEVAGMSLTTMTFRVEAARDSVLVTPLDGGGLISYARPDGTFLHTLNTAEGFARKLAQLGIRLDRNG